jgi:hypothetical protein
LQDRCAALPKANLIRAVELLPTDEDRPVVPWIAHPENLLPTPLATCEQTVLGRRIRKSQDTAFGEPDRVDRAVSEARAEGGRKPARTRGQAGLSGSQLFDMERTLP